MGRKQTKETRKKIKDHNAKYWLGKKMPRDVVDRIAAKHRGKKHPHSEKTKQNMKKAWIMRKARGDKPPKHDMPHSKDSRKQMSLSHIGLQCGSNSPHWKGGLTNLSVLIRASFKYRQWRSDIFTRDNYTCQLCGNRGNKIHADHYPKTFSEIFYENKIKSLEDAYNCEEFWNINYGRTLCIDCHKKTDTWGGKSRKRL